MLLFEEFVSDGRLLTRMYRKAQCSELTCERPSSRNSLKLSIYEKTTFSVRYVYSFSVESTSLETSGDESRSVRSSLSSGFVTLIANCPARLLLPEGRKKATTTCCPAKHSDEPWILPLRLLVLSGTKARPSPT